MSIPNAFQQAGLEDVLVCYVVHADGDAQHGTQHNEAYTTSNDEEDLVAELNRHHWNINKHSYSAEEVRLILKYLCQP